MRILMSQIGLALLLACCTARAESPDVGRQLASGESFSRAGNLHQAIEQFQSAYSSAATSAEKARAANGLGVALFRKHRYKEAQPLLAEAFQGAANGPDKARYAIDLGSLYAGQRDIDEAESWYRRALELAPQDPALGTATRLNLARLAAAGDKPALLAPLVGELSKIDNPRERGRYAVNLGAQAAALGPKGVKIAYEAYDIARNAEASLNDPRLRAEIFDGLSQVYEDQRRDVEALQLCGRGAVSAQSAEARDLLLRLEWRRGRLLKRLGKTDQALAAYQRAVDHIEAIRQDIPVEYQDGKSSFRETLEPVYVGLADLLLAEADKQGGALKPELYRRARDTLELIKQSELEDFLGDRCAVDTVRRSRAGALPARTAVLYPIILPDRLDLLLETADGIERRTIAVTEKEVRQAAGGFAARLRGNQQGYEQLSRKLYDWLLRPVESAFEQAKIDTVIFVPDGVLRLVPVGALHDGSRFAVQKYAIATVPGLSLIDAQRGPQREQQVLLAGLAEPGPAVGKIPPALLKMLTGDDAAAAPPVSRALTYRRSLSPADEDATLGEAHLRKQLALPGVKQEIEALGHSTQGETLFNQTFTLDRFKQRVGDGHYRVVHIASHGVFSSSANASFIMTYDDLLTLDGLQGLLRSENLRDQPIDLLTLSACQTAEGDDRAPLGLAGAAIKARARSVLGTLWPVADDAATALMPRFYQALAQPDTTKIRALQAAQIALLERKELQHPFFWAPFILVGSWQ